MNIAMEAVHNKSVNGNENQLQCAAAGQQKPEANALAGQRAANNS